MMFGLVFPRGLRRTGAALLLLALASCGGGDRVSTFAPQRILVFGDESSVIVGSSGSVTDVDGNVLTAPAGAKYTINQPVLDTMGQPTAALACGTNPNWSQLVGARFGFGFPECNPYAGAPAGRIYAQVGARVADIATQVATHSATSGFANTDLVTVMVGQRDILSAYALYPAQSAEAVVSIAEAAGRALGVQVNTIANAGGRVLISTVVNQGSTPFAVAQNLISGERAALLQRMTERFNAGMRGSLLNDGRLIGLVQADEQLQVISNNAAAFGYVSVSTAACTTPTALTCVNGTNATATLPATPGTLVSGATLVNYLWADDRHFSVDAHVRIGNLAVTRAVNNPF